ncbi:hypothetical protein [[Limnothrix rosea] IAM M-220]|uniref:hypothetical protein n=1 Tax=[Limnothrix rosea] IAM M-220 TaxID=454133 RepID=UPI000967ECC0|nr:hypothetical protein [[Limnothrix rosea] IAM M-220]OKH18443.1 hypothetical protein NIES208_05640 [[Limnothrix rosea] IAM M-220]
MKKAEAIQLLVTEGWTKADASRALVDIDFSLNPDELIIRRASSSFAGQELYKRQRLQAAQKGMVTKRTKEVTLTQEVNRQLKTKSLRLTSKNQELTEVNSELQKDNKALKTYIDQIRLRLSLDMKQLLKFEDSEIRRELAKWFSKTQG